MTVPSQGHYGFHSFTVVDWFCLFIYLWVLTFPLTLTDLSAWVGFCTSSPQQGVKYQLWYLKTCLWKGGGTLWISHQKFPTAKFLPTWGLNQKVLPGSLTDLSACVGFCTSSPQLGVKYQLWNALKCHALGHSILYK